MARIIISEIELTQHCWVRFFDLDLPSPIGHGYQQVVSFNAFFHGLKKRNWSKDRLYVECDWDEMGYVKLEYIAKFPVIKVDSMWEFYECIGYDHKRNVYTPKSP